MLINRCYVLIGRNLLICVGAFIVCAAFTSENAYSYDLWGVDLKVHGGTSETYDDNITYVKDGVTKDFITGLNIGASAKYEGKRVDIELSGNIKQQFFAEHPNFNNNSQDLTVKCFGDLSKYDHITATNTFSHTYEPRSFEEAFGIPAGHYSYFRNRFSIDYTRDILRQLTAIVRYTNAIDAPSRDDLSDSYLNSGGAELDYALSSATIIFASYDFSARKFDPGTNAFTNTMAVGIRHYITKQLYVDARGGMDYIISYNKQEYFQPMARISLTDEIDQNTKASISFTKQYYTNAYSQDLFSYWEISGAFSKQILERLSCSGSVFYGKGTYVAFDIEDDLLGASASLTYELTEHWKATASYNYSMTSSNLRTREYAKNVLYVGVSAEF